jgi:glycosyltransferase involved in cell wall biosynthesis
MFYLAYFIFTFALIQFIVVIVNTLFNQQPKSDHEHFNKLVSILIPARNEENNIAYLLTDLQSQEYKNIEIIVFNDLSTDQTEAIIAQFAKKDQRIQLINSEGLPETWLGKNYACHSLAQKAKGEYLLFIDADVRIKKGSISNSISLAQKHKAALLSIFPKQKMESLGEYLTVPIMNYILLTLLPLVLVLKSKFPSMAAANGQFMLFDSVKYFETLPHEKFKNNRVEDIEIARYYKQKQFSVICTLGDDTIECRMYNGFEDAVKGFSKNVVNFFGNSFLATLLFWIITTFGCLIVLSKLSMVLFFLYLAIIIATKIIVSILSKQNIFLNLILFVPQQLTLGILLYKALIYKFNKKLKWKGRTI